MVNDALQSNELCYHLIMIYSGLTTFLRMIGSVIIDTVELVTKQLDSYNRVLVLVLYMGSVNDVIERRSLTYSSC
jgi:hypothetical protein